MKVELLNADVLEYADEGEEKVKYLNGHVRLKHQSVYLSCDTAILYEHANRISAFGNVLIRHGDSVSMTAKRLLYDGSSRTADLEQDVVLSDRKMRLNTRRLRYDVRESAAWYTEGGEVRDGDNTLTSQTGYYHSKTKDIYFRHRVVLKNPRYTVLCDTLRYNDASETAYFLGPTSLQGEQNTVYCEYGWHNTRQESSMFSGRAWLHNPEYHLSGDTLWYDHKTGLSRAKGNVAWNDSSGKTILKGRYAEHSERNGRSIMTGKPLLISVMEHDSLFLTADTLFAFYDTLETEEAAARSFRAYRHVKIYRSDLQAACDSLSYSGRDSVFRLYREPVLWSDDTQMTADTIFIHLKNNRVDHIRFMNAAFIAQMEDSLLFNQLTGRKINAYFENDSLRTLEVSGNGQSIYYARDDSGAVLGANKAECSDLLLRFRDSKVHQVAFLNKPEAAFHPITQINPADLRLKGFVWLEERKPGSKEELLEGIAN